MENNKIRAIAFYLPQFYPTPENDKWWEPGFTEWTNVTRSKPLFKGHYQPRLPRDLGFYDLRVNETRERQAELARRAGIEGFCYWHYWFAGRRMLDIPFREVVESGKPDFPFCLCWANHSWYAKTWTPGAPDKLLVEQTYPGEEDYINHFNAMLPAFQDKRYMKVDGKLIFGIFSPQDFKDFCHFSEVWNRLAVENGLKGFYFFCLIQAEFRLKQINTSMYDAIVFDTVHDGYANYKGSYLEGKFRQLLFNLKKPYPVDYEKYVNVSIDLFKKHKECIPCIEPDFDHSPRSGWRGIILHNSTPQKWGRLCKQVKEIILEKKEGRRLLFIKAWNEWGEGNYLEPDQKNGEKYLDELRKALFSEFYK